MRLIAIGGEPAVGKTTIVKRFRGTMKYFTFGLVKGYCDGNRYIIGTYNGHKFDGTDRLSMAVQPEFVKFLEYVEKRDPNSIVLFEGDRLFNASLFDVCGGYDLHIIIIETTDMIRNRRHKTRQDNQPEKFLKAKKTKTKNIETLYHCKVMPNNTESDELKIMEHIKSVIAPL